MNRDEESRLHNLEEFLDSDKFCRIMLKFTSLSLTLTIEFQITSSDNQKFHETLPYEKKILMKLTSIRRRCERSSHNIVRIRKRYAN